MNPTRSPWFALALALVVMGCGASPNDATGSGGGPAGAGGTGATAGTGGTVGTSGTGGGHAGGGGGSTSDGGHAMTGPCSEGPNDPPPYGAYGSYMPGKSTTGVRAGTMLIPYTDQFGPIVDGTLTITTDGTSICGYDIPAYVRVKAAGVTLKNCRIHGPATIPAADVSHNLVTAYDAACTNLVVRDCTLFASAPDHDNQGIQGKSFLAERNDVYEVVDGIDPLNDGAVILANWIHDLAWFSPDSNHMDGHSHNDCVQFEGGSATVQYNNLEGFLSPTAGDGPARPYDQSNSCFQITDLTSPPTTNLVMTHNWMDGGQVAVNVGGTSYTDLGQLTDNIFGDNQKNDGVTILMNAPRASIGLTLSNNHYGACDRPLHKPSRNGTTVDTGNGVQGG